MVGVPWCHCGRVKGLGKPKAPLGGWAPIYKPYETALWKGSHNPILGGLTITMAIDHLLKD